MYNRYIPQSDGSYRRNQMQEPGRQQQQQRQQRPSPPPPAPQSREPEERAPAPPSPAPRSGMLNAGSFLRQLLPQNLDMEDLLIIILLLLMSEDGGEDRNTALLTLAIYLFL